MSTSLSMIYKIRRLPVRLLDETLEATTMPEVKREGFSQKMFKAPETGKLLVVGTAGPVINHLYEQGRSCAGMSFVEHFGAKLQGEVDKPPVSDVILLYGVGNEPAKNAEYATKLLEGIIDHCKNKKVLLVVETHLSVTNFHTKYGIQFDNKLTLQLKSEDVWMS